MIIKRLRMTWPACTIYLWSIADFQKWSKSIRFSRGPKWVSCIKIPSFTPYQLSLSKKMNTQRFRWIYIFHSLHRYFFLINFIRAPIFSISFWVSFPGYRRQFKAKSKRIYLLFTKVRILVGFSLISKSVLSIY